MPGGNIDVVLRLLNSRRFSSQLHGSAMQVRKMGAEFNAAATASSGLDSSTRMASGALYGIAAASRAAQFGLAAMGAVVVGAGVQFNATMESNTLAFEHFAGGVTESKALTQDLFDIAAKTPFEFTDITTAARKFLAFGYSVSESTELLKTLGDTLSYTGGGPLEIQRITKAFGDIRAKGRLMQQELNQLTNVGINPYEMMELGGLKLTADQLKNIGRAGIPASEAIYALKSGMDQTFGGGAEKYLETFNGQWNRLKDNFKQASGTATGGIFEYLKGALKFLNEQFDKINKFVGGATFKKIGSDIIGFFVKAWNIAKGAITDFLWAIAPIKPFWTNVLWPFIQGFAKGIGAVLVIAFKVFIGAIRIVSLALGWLGSKLGWAKGVFEVLGMVVSWFVGPGVLGFLGKILGRLGGVFSVIGGALRFVAGLFKVFGKAIAWMFPKLRIAAHLLKIHLLRPFRALVGFLRDAKKLIGGVIAGASGAVGFIKDKLPGFAAGGTVTQGGMALVGEKGPELVTLPRGSNVAPLTPAKGKRGSKPSAMAAAGGGSAFMPASFHVESPIYLDRRQIGLAMGDYVAERNARA